ncbi:phage tail protein [Bacillus paranthracis]
MSKLNGILHVVDFKTERIVTAIRPDDYWDDKRHWEIKNNVDTLDFTVFDGTKHVISLMQQNLVLKQVRDGRIVPYVITEIAKDTEKNSLTVYASAEWILLAKAGYIKPQRMESKTAYEFASLALAGIEWEIGNIEYAGFHTMTIDEFIDPLKLLKDTAALFDLEIEYRVEILGSRIVGRYVDMVKKRGRETGKEVTVGKDLKGIVRKENSQNICTALIPFVKGEEDKLITIESVNNNLLYLVDNDAFQRWSKDSKHKYGFYTPETEDQNMSPKRLLTLTKTEMKKRVNASVSYEVDAAAIGRVFGLNHELINEGDTIRIKDTSFKPRLYLEARAIAGDESFKDPEQDKYVFGDYYEIVDQSEELRKMYNRLISSLGSKVGKDLLEQLEKQVNESIKENEKKIEQIKEESETAKTLAEKVEENLKNYQTAILESENPPTTGLIVGRTMWQDISNGKPGVLKRWTGEVWDVVVPDVAAQVKAVWEKTEKALEGRVTSKQVEDYVSTFQIPELKNNVTKQKEDLLNEIAERVAVKDYNLKVTDLERKILANERGIELSAKRDEIYLKEDIDGTFAKVSYIKQLEAKLQILDEGILAEVKKGNIISVINQTAEKIKIEAELIDLVGKIEASWLKAGLLQGMTIKTSNEKEYIHMANQVLKFVNQDTAKITIGFEDEHKSKSLNPYIILGQGDGTGRNVGTIYKDGNGVYYRYIDNNGLESNMRLTAQGNVGITAQTSMWLNSNGTLVVDGGYGVSLKHLGKTVAEFIQVNGVNYDLLLGGNHIIRSSTFPGYDKLLQVKNSTGNEFRGIEVAEVTAHGGIRSDTNLWAEKDSYAMQHINRSTIKLKTAVHDLPFSALDKIRELKVKQYFLKRDMYELYQMRMNKPEDRIEPYTTKDIDIQYGFVAEETDDVFTTPEKDGIKLYSTLSILTASVQELEQKHDDEIQELRQKHEQEIQKLKEEYRVENEKINQRINEVKTVVENLINNKG